MNENIDDSNREKLANELLHKFPRYDKGIVADAANAVYNSLFGLPEAGFGYGAYVSEKTKVIIKEKGSEISLTQDLALDSLDLVELAVELEEKGFVIDEKMLKDWRAPRGPKLIDLLEMAYESKEYEQRRKNGL